MARIARENVREKILDAAEKRLWYFGIKKTTIDEIAADAGVGKGTVYLYFDSKEDISLAIFVGYKLSILREQEKIVTDPDMSSVDKVREFLTLPLLMANEKCNQFPQAVELVLVLKPHLAEHMRPYNEQEIRLLERILIEGNQRGEFSIASPDRAARSLKYMTTGFMPPYPCVTGSEAISQEVGSLVDLAVNGLKGRCTL